MPISRALRAAVLIIGLATTNFGPASAQPRSHGIRAVSVSALTARGFEVRAALREALVLQKGVDVYWCVMHLANTSPMSYQSACYAVR